MSLTDDWKAGKLKQGWYWIKNKVRGIVPDQVIGNDWLLSGRCNVEEVLTSCDYDELQRLKKGWELYSHETVITKQLRQLLRECKTFFEEENPKDFTVLSERMEDLLTKINEVLK